MKVEVIQLSEIKTSELTDSVDNELDKTLSLKDKSISIARKTRNSVRRFFAASNENSIVASSIESIYFALLSCKARVLATFLLSFSTVSLAFSYLINESFNYFLSDINTYYSVFTLLVSLVLFTSSVSLHELFSTSKILSKLSFIYNQHNSLFNISNDRFTFQFSFSTAFFVGIIAGIISAVYTVGSIIGFFISLLFIIFIFNRPECGLLTTLFLIPFIGTNTMVTFLLFTFVSYIYKFMIGKRHLDFGFTALLLILCIIYLCTKQTGTINSLETKALICHITFFLSCLLAINLIRTTVMFRRVLGILVKMTRIYSVVLLAYFLSRLFFSYESVTGYISSIGIDSIISSLVNTDFILPFLTVSIPLNFSELIAAKRKHDFAFGLFFVIVQSLCSVFVATLPFIFIAFLSCTVILATLNKKFLLLIIPLPVLSYLAYNLIEKIPQIIEISSDSIKIAGVSTLNDSLLFGTGFVNNFSDAFLNLHGQNSVSSLLSQTGVIGITLFGLTLMSIIATAFKSVSVRRIRTGRARILSMGLLCSVLSFIALSFFANTLSDFRIAYLFAGILSLSYTAVRCYDADYIDDAAAREYF